MDDFAPPSYDYSAQQTFDTHYEEPYIPPDPYVESYNLATTDITAQMIRHSREQLEEQQQNMAQELPVYQAPVYVEPQPQALAADAYSHFYAGSHEYENRPVNSVLVPRLPRYATRLEKEARWAALRANGDKTPFEALDALAKGQQYYYMPNEQVSWRRPVKAPAGTVNVEKWWEMFNYADAVSQRVAKWLDYYGRRDEDGWIRPREKELRKMNFWEKQRYAFYYSEFAKKYNRPIPLWIKLLSGIKTCTTYETVMA